MIPPLIGVSSRRAIQRCRRTTLAHCWADTGHARRACWGAAKTPADLGEHFGYTLYAAEVDYAVAHEWATCAEDVLWRRTKCGLHMTLAEQEATARYFKSQHGMEPA